MQWDTSNFALQILIELILFLLRASNLGRIFRDYVQRGISRYELHSHYPIRYTFNLYDIVVPFFTQDDSYSIPGSVYAMVVEFKTFPDLFGFAAFPFCLLYTCNHYLPSMHDVCYLPTISCNTSNVRSHKSVHVGIVCVGSLLYPQSPLLR